MSLGNNAAHPISIVGLVYDAAMQLHVSTKANEFEMPERLSRCYQIFNELDILNRMQEICVSIFYRNEIFQPADSVNFGQY